MHGFQTELRKDCISLWPLWVAIGFPLLLTVLEATPIALDFFFVLIGVPALCFAWAGVSTYATILAIKWLRQRAWRRAVISAILPLVILSVGFHYIAFIGFCSNAGDTLHFYARYPAYMKMIRATPSDGNARLVTINLGGMSWASRGFVYDESDEIMREPSAQSVGWKARAQDLELGCGYGALPIFGPSALTRHWYLASFAC